MKKKVYLVVALIAVVLCALLLIKCNSRVQDKRKNSKAKVVNIKREMGNGVYHWKTTFNPSDEEWDFIKRHNVKKLYVRMFDVTSDEFTNYDSYHVTPVATTKFKQKPREGVSIVPCVFITLDALRSMNYASVRDEIAELLVTRVLNMMDYNELGDVKEIQLDCDWTESTRNIFFNFCDNVKDILEKKEIALGVTIRLHQLSQPCPPAHYGILMLYNTGGVKAFDTKNSILSYNEVKPYLTKCNYALPLDVAYPAFSWNVWFRDNKFQALISEVNVKDTKLYKNIGENKYQVLKNHNCSGQDLKCGDVLRHEGADVAEVLKVKRVVEKAINQKDYSVAIYHLSSKDIKNISEDEINSIYKMD